MSINRTSLIVCFIILSFVALFVFIFMQHKKTDDDIEFKIVTSDKKNIVFTASSLDVSNCHWRKLLIDQLLKLHSSSEIQVSVKFYLDAEHFSIVQNSYKISFMTHEYMKIYKSSSDSWSEMISIPLQNNGRNDLLVFKNDIDFLLDLISETMLFRLKHLQREKSSGGT